MTNGPVKGASSDEINFNNLKSIEHLEVYTTHSQMLGKDESGGGPIFKVVLKVKKKVF